MTTIDSNINKRVWQSDGHRLSKPKIVFLADLQNSYYRYIRNSVPIGMGYVAAYLESIFDSDIEILQFRKFEELHDALATHVPAVVAFGSYSWNTALTRRTAAYVKQRHPGTVVAVGGPDVSQVPSMATKLLETSPQFDFVIPNEGEGPMRELLTAMFAGGGLDELRRCGVNGCLSLGAKGELTGTVMDRFDDAIEAIPSPYLTGLMDRFLADPDYLPIIQTARGCPYHCTFCVSGKNSWSKVKGFPLDRIKAEIDYVAERAAARYLRLADENFGIQHRDVEIAEYVMERRRHTGFPQGVSIYTDKHPTERVKQINLLMRELMPFCISFQSASSDVLNNIKRINLKNDTIKAAVAFANDNGLMLVSELIFALPGETAKSFLTSIDLLIDMRFESIAINQLRILKGTEMDLPEDRKKHGVRTLFSMSENGYTRHPEMENIEIDEWVISNNTLSEEEYFELNKFIFMFDFAHSRCFLRELLFFFENYGIRATELLMRVVRTPDLCPVLTSYAERFIAGLRGFLKETPEHVVEFVRENIAKDPSKLMGIYRMTDLLMIELLMEKHLPDAVAEIAATGRRLHAERWPSDAQFDRSADSISHAMVAAFISLDQAEPEVISVSTEYDMAAWAADNYRQPLANYPISGGGTVGLRIRNYQAYESLWGNSDTIQERYIRHFATFNSSNRRRHLAPLDGSVGNGSE